LSSLFDLLGLSFAPRIRDVGDQQLYRIKGQILDAQLKPLLNRRIDRQLILDCWDDMLRVAGSLKHGWMTASLLMGKMGFGEQWNLSAFTVLLLPKPHLYVLVRYPG